MKLARVFILGILGACQSAPPSLNMLTKRSDYDGAQYAEKMAEDTEQFLLRSSTSKSHYSDIRIHPRELPTGDVFLGGWIRTTVVPYVPKPKVSMPQEKPKPHNYARTSGK